MDVKTKELKERRAALASQMREMHEKAETEDRGFTPEERESWDSMTSDIETLDGRIEDSQRAYAIGDLPDDVRQQIDTGEQVSTDDVTEERNSAFEALLRSGESGESGLSAEHRNVLREMRAQSVGTDSAGGYTVPEGFQSQIWQAMLAFGGIRNAATVIQTSTGNNLPFITNDDTGNVGALLAENAADSEQDTVFGETVLGAYKYTSKIVRVSKELLQDNAVNLEQHLAMIFAERLGRATAAHYATGTGSGQPNGLVTASTLGKTAASATAITYAELIDLKHSVDPAHRINATWAFNDTTFKAIKSLLDGDSRPLWQPDIAGVVPATIDGDRFVIDQGIPAMTTGLKSVVYGDLSKYYIRDVLTFDLTRLVERYAEYHQVGFVAIMRTDADLIDAGSNPVKHLIQA